MPLVLCRNKTSPLTYVEMDGNFEFLQDLTDTILSESGVRGLISVINSGSGSNDQDIKLIECTIGKL